LGSKILRLLRFLAGLPKFFQTIGVVRSKSLSSIPHDPFYDSVCIEDGILNVFYGLEVEAVELVVFVAVVVAI